MKRSPFLTGLLVGLALTAALLGVAFAGDALLGLPLAPFDLFAWLTRVLPGPLITFGIDSMVGTLITLGFNVADTAKTAEHIMSVMIVLGGGTALGGVLFAIFRRLPDHYAPYIAGWIGLLSGLAMIFIHRAVSFGSITLTGIVWLLLIFAVWGGVLGEAYRRLFGMKMAAAETPEMEVEQKSRREFLITLGGAAAAITVVGAGVALLAGPRRDDDHIGVTSGAPGGDDMPDMPAGMGVEPVELAAWINPDAVEGTRHQLTRQEDHYLIDINPRPPELDAATWTLPISGLVDSPIELTLSDLMNNYEPVHRYITLSCISNRLGGNLIGTTLWTGVRLQDVLADVGVQSRATQIEIRSVDGFHETLALDLLEQDPRIMLVYAWNNEPLTHEHGFPLRIWIPDRFGMKQPRWITEMEVTDEYRPGYWVQRGWDQAAIVRTTSVIDTVNPPEDSADGMAVPIGGIAYAGARGISRVEISVDGSEWQAAELLEPLSDTTWVLWRYAWPFEAGRHVFEVRCVDGNGDPQIRAAADPHPSGATGIHSVRQQVG